MNGSIVGKEPADRKLLSLTDVMSDLTELIRREAGSQIALDDQQIGRLARHLEMVLETNRQFNLTSITDPLEAVRKHVIDSILPAEEFAGAKTILDLGSGPGYPGIPLAVLFPETRVLLVESTQKKARFLQSVVKELGLTNVTVFPERCETVLKRLPPDEVGILVARAVGSIEKLLKVLAPVSRRFGRLLLFKGRRAAEEMEAAAPIAQRLRLHGKIAREYSLPEGAGEHCLVEYRR